MYTFYKIFFKKVFKKVLTFVKNSYIMKKIEKGIREMKKFEVQYIDRVKMKTGKIDIFGETIEEAREIFRKNRALKLLSIHEIIYESEENK